MEDQIYKQLVAVLANADALADLDPFDRANAIKIALGEIGNIWPCSLVDAVPTDLTTLPKQSVL